MQMAATGATSHDPASKDFKLPVGTNIRNYQLEAFIHGGNFGVAYRASLSTTPSSPPLVLKVLRGPMGHDKKLFDTEVGHLRLASSLAESVRAVRLVDSFQDDTHQDCYCIVMKPFCESGNIEQLLQNDPHSYTLEDCMRWLHEVSETLYTLGTKVKMYHGDINPRNVLLKEEGQFLHAYVADFGLCVRLRAFGMLEKDIPTEHYSVGVSPEMLEGDRSFDGRAAVWSWAVLAYALLDRSMQGLDQTQRGVWDTHDYFLEQTHPWVASLQAKWPSTGPPPKELLELMQDCLQLRDDRVCMATVVNCMRKLTGTKQPWSPLAADLPSTGECFQEFIPLLAAARSGDTMDPPPSEDQLVKLLVVSEELLRAHRRRTRVLPPADLAGLYMGQAQALELREEHAESRAPLVWAVKALRTATPAVHPGMLFDAIKRLAEWSMRNSEYASAVPLFEEALGMCGGLTDQFGPFRPDLLAQLADARESAGDNDGAMAALEALSQELEDTEEKVMLLANMARLSLRAGNPEQGLEKAKEAVEACVASVGGAARTAAREMLASAYRAMSDHPAAEAAKAQARLERAQAQASVEDVTAPSVEALRDELEERQRLHPATHPQVADALCNLGRALRQSRLYAESLEQLNSALLIRQQRSEHEQVGFVFLELMTTALLSGGPSSALPYANEAVAAYQHAYGPDTYNAQVATALKAQALCLQKTGRLLDAEGCIRSLVSLMENAATPVDRSRYFDALHDLARVLDGLGASRRKEAIEAYNTAATVATAGPVDNYEELFSCIIREGCLLIEDKASGRDMFEHMQRVYELFKEFEDLPASCHDPHTQERITAKFLSYAESGSAYALSQRSSTLSGASAQELSSSQPTAGQEEGGAP